MSIDDKYTYPNSGGVLRNLLSIRDSTVLDDALNKLVTVRWAQLRVALPSPIFDFRRLAAIHRHLMQDVFPWAGALRDVDVQAVGAGIV
ncbi:hypothetical protein MHJ85_10270 [Brevibacterium ravenspurgense]|uniref:hypothetical protein n=1 Tax=Brevibacterium ravenspurgense TaxID=479117 RepID=UPI001EF38F69|nr:hypothetical protein [Brevibacterium ravenspurgense]MCG7301635.1 hypothetical protein [Brevibacterium ravenspurgense]